MSATRNTAIKKEAEAAAQSFAALCQAVSLTLEYLEAHESASTHLGMLRNARSDMVPKMFLLHDSIKRLKEE